uniref:cytochrome c oxidase subunit III n=1 Tax=Neoplerochila paliatseasi TaxID=2704509 RepID=UPI0013E93EF4|nr:cytochrome c oxidase subunit III [Neoplerochila paliatseasi]QHR79413.1 cytochrome c oxidase subunit III [Neoplerochila paliatseasi]
MNLSKNHPFHMVNYSPWPITGSIGAMTMLSGLTLMFINKNMYLMEMGLLITILTMYQWWRDVSREATLQGLHNSIVIKGMKISMILFIISEIMFFVSFFWAFFHSSLSPTVEIGMTWPPSGISTFNPNEIPLLNTMILLTSGMTVTWAHHSLIFNKMNQAKMSLYLTVMLGVVFTMLQGYEYLESSFTISDSIYGSCFFMATGFHGLHVIIGTLFLTVCLIRHKLNHFSKNHHFGFEAASWYWHFVDVVWLMLYIMIYWWGS